MKSLPCPAPLWPRFSVLLDTVLDLDEPERAAWLEALPERDAELKPWLAALLQGGPRRSTREWLDRPAAVGAAADGDGEAFAAGQRLGPWRLLRPLGSGGMGSVWLAARADGSYEREVALKLPHAHLLSGALRARFARERNILAGLGHPNIARFYDAGLADDGQPWLALEYVEGQPLTTYCEAQQLDIAARIELVQQIAAAVQAAHARLIVHRDLKPANVLVTADGQVKLLDFGIAKLLDAEPDGTELTQAASRMATPDYAAPEQIDGGAITVATDIYALGVMLYELLAGVRPFASRSRLGQMLAWSAEAPLASSRVSGARRRVLAGDLDAILAKALEPVATRRYASMEAFAADLARHRANLPIRARRIGRWQRAGKFLRRNRRGAGVAALLVLMLVVGVSAVLWQAREARQQARRAEAVKAFLVGVFKASDPRIASDRPRGQITARELLDLSAGRIDSRFADDPEVQIELLRTVADIYRELGEASLYDSLQARQLELVRQHYGPHHPNILDGAVEAGAQACARAELQGCTAAQAAADALLRAAGDDDPERRGQWWINEGLRLQADPLQREAALAAYRQAVALYAARAPASRGHVTALLELGSMLQRLQRVPESVEVHRRAIALAESLPERNDAEMQTLWGNLGVTYQQDGQLAEAGTAFSRSADYAERTTGADSPTAWSPRGQAARTLHLAGEREASWREYERLMPQLPKDEARIRAPDAAAAEGCAGP